MIRPAFNFVVGSTFQFQAAGGMEESLSVRLIGFLEPESLMVTHPLAPDGQLLPLVSGDSVVIRFGSGDNLYAFESRVRAVCEQPFPYLHLDYPRGVQGTMTRRAVRFPVNDMAMMLVMEEDGQKISVALADISYSGARLVAGSRLGEVGERFSIEIPHQGSKGAERVVLPCEIRYVREENGQTSGRRRYHHGVEFTGLGPAALRFIETYIGDKLAECRHAAT